MWVKTHKNSYPHGCEITIIYVDNFYENAVFIGTF